MSTHTTESQSLGESLASPIAVGEPQLAANLAVFPLTYAGARLGYVSAATAGEQVTIGEQAGTASVGDLTVTNKGDTNVLLYEGEELLGAQQNRVIDISALLGPATTTSISVSCVERGRWDGSRHAEPLRRAGRAADADLRRKKKAAMLARAEAGMAARSSQQEVWEEVDRRQADLAAPSATDSLTDVLDQRRGETEEISSQIGLTEGQCGMVAAIGGEIAIVDMVSRPEVFADLYPALASGYALDAVRARKSGTGGRVDPPPPPDIATVRGLTLLVGDAAPSARQPGLGLGQTAYFSTAGIAGSALLVEDELIQLSAYPSPGGRPGETGPHRPARSSRIRRPFQRGGRGL